MLGLEPGVGWRKGWREAGRYATGATVGAGLVAGVFNIGTLTLLIRVAGEAGYTDQQTMSWAFSVYVGGGLLSLLLAPYYQKPIAGAWTIAGLVLVGAALPGFTANEAAGAFLLAGLLVLASGFSGLMGAIVRWLPRPIVAGMIAGVLLRFGTGMITALASAPLLCGVAFAGYLLLQKHLPRFPGVLGALGLGMLTALLTGAVNPAQLTWQLVLPRFCRPEFGLMAFFSISLPLALTVLGAENMQAIGVLLTEGYDEIPAGTKVPVNAVTVASGVGMMAVALAGGHSVNLAGVLTAICGGPGAGEDKSGRYVAAMVAGICSILLGVLAGTAVTWVNAFPAPLVSLTAGLAMASSLANAFRRAWSGKHQLGTLFALVTAASGISLAGIGAPFWALLLGIGLSYYLERDDFADRP